MNGAYTVATNTIFRQHLLQTLVRGEDPQLFLLAFLGEVRKYQRRASLYINISKILLGHFEKVQAVNLLIANNFLLIPKFSCSCKNSISLAVSYFFISSASVTESFPVAVTEVEAGV